MGLHAAVGQAQALDGREAGLQAAHQALEQMGKVSPVLGLVVASHQYEAQQVVSGVASLVGDTPPMDFSAPAGITSEGCHPHSVVVALLGGGDAEVNMQRLVGYTQGSREVARHLTQLLEKKTGQTILLFTDGFNTDAKRLYANLLESTNMVGGLSSGDLHTGHRYQIGSGPSGSGGVALALLDIAWQSLVESDPGAEIAAVQETLNWEVLVADSYTLGQIVPSNQAGLNT